MIAGCDTARPLTAEQAGPAGPLNRRPQADGACGTSACRLLKAGSSLGRLIIALPHEVRPSQRPAYVHVVHPCIPA